MTDRSWNTGDTSSDEGTIGDPKPVLVSLHFLRTALVRRWRVWIGLACLGMLAGLGWSFATPVPSEGTASVILAHESGTDPSLAMDTDISLIRTRTVAESVIDELGLSMSPDAFQASVTAEAVTSKVMTIAVAAPDDGAAKLRVETLINNYLQFRATQIQLQSKAQVDSYDEQVASLERKVTRLTGQYEALSGTGADGESQASEVLTQRSQLNARIDGLKDSIAEATLETDSIVVASRVLDPASIVPHSPLRRLALMLMSGLVGGASLGIGVVLFAALTSDRLHRREEVALALGAPVRFSVTGPRRQWRRPRRHLRGGRPSERDLEILVRGLDTAIGPRTGPAARLALATVDEGGGAGEHVISALSTRLSARGLSVFVVDLSEAGRLSKWSDTPATQQRADDPLPPPGVAVTDTSGGVETDQPTNLKKLDRLTPLPQIAELGDLARQRNEAEARLVETRRLVEERTRDQDRVETAVQKVRARYRSDQERLDHGLVTSTTDRERIQSHLVSLKRRIGELEDDELEVMEQVEDARTELDTLTVQIEHLDDKIGAATSARDNVVRGLPPHVGATGPSPNGLDKDHHLVDRPTAPVVFRPEGVPSLARGPIGVGSGVSSALLESDARRQAWDVADVVLTLAALDPAVGVDHLTSWADRLVLLVTAGRSSAERLRTIGALVRTSGLDLLFAMMVGTDRTDASLGAPDPAGAEWPEPQKTSSWA